MKSLTTKLALLLACSSLLTPATISAAAATEAEEAPPTYVYKEGLISTWVHGIYVPGRYINIDENARAAYIPGGVGLVVVDKDAALPEGAKFVP